MKKNKLKLFAIASTMAIVLPTSIAQSLVSGGKLVSVPTVMGKAVHYKQYSDYTLLSAGCDPATYKKMVSDYVAARTADHANEYLMLTHQLATQTPNHEGGMGPASGKIPCFESASNQIANAVRFADMVVGVFTGKFDMGALIAGTSSMWLNKACSEINNLTGSMVSNATGGILGGANNAMGQAINNYNQAVGGQVIGINNGSITTTNGNGTVVQNNGGGISQSLCNSSGIGCN